MSGYRRAALAAFALGVAVAFPVCAAFAQDLPPDAAGALNPLPEDSAPDGPAPTYPWVDSAPTDDAPVTLPAPPSGRRPSGVAKQLAEWVAVTDDDNALPFIIVDKLGARIFAFDPGGEFLGSAPVLVGLARGDDSAPGIGELQLSQISPDQRTTPAGRFVAGFGPSNGHGAMLWVDLPDAISLHPVMSVSPGEHRLQRIKSSDPGRHRISYGCINVPKAFYDGVVLPALAGGSAVVYVLPDTKAIDDVFPAFAATLGGDHEREPPNQQVSSAARLSESPDHDADRAPDLAPPRLEPADDSRWIDPPPAP
jgi:hypothetical protein